LSKIFSDIDRRKTPFEGEISLLKIFSAFPSTKIPQSLSLGLSLFYLTFNSMGVGGVLELHLYGARDLRITQTFGKQDPYCKIILAGKKYHTSVSNDTHATATWGESFKLIVPPTAGGDFFFIEVKNKNVGLNTVIGGGKVKVAGELHLIPYCKVAALNWQFVASPHSAPLTISLI